MVYFFTRRQFGKVATPIAVFSARMPTPFLSFYGKVSRLDKKLQLSSQTAVLARERVASINACLYCMDASRWYAIKQSPEHVYDLTNIGLNIGSDGLCEVPTKKAVVTS